MIKPLTDEQQRAENQERFEAKLKEMKSPEYQAKLEAFRMDKEMITITAEQNLAYDIAMENNLLMENVRTPEREKQWNVRTQEVRKKYGL